jgi:hypothetical protein
MLVGKLLRVRVVVVLLLLLRGLLQRRGLKAECLEMLLQCSQGGCICLWASRREVHTQFLKFLFHTVSRRLHHHIGFTIVQLLEPTCSTR